MLQIKNLQVALNGKTFLKNINLEILPSKLHVLMGQNGSGKSSLALTLMGHPNYNIEDGLIFFNESLLNELSTEKRAQLNIFLAFQNPIEIPGLQVCVFLKEAYNILTKSNISVVEFREKLYKVFDLVGLDHQFAYRYLNEGFSGGEKKKFEIVQLLLFKPKLAILDEIDAGLDVDSLKIVADLIELSRKENPELSIILITHYSRILKYLNVDQVHLMHDGSLIKSGDINLADAIEERGYDQYIKQI